MDKTVERPEVRPRRKVRLDIFFANLITDLPVQVKVGGSAISSMETRNFPTPPHGGCGFSTFRSRQESRAFAYRISIAVVMIAIS